MPKIKIHKWKIIRFYKKYNSVHYITTFHMNVFHSIIKMSIQNRAVVKTRMSGWNSGWSECHKNYLCVEKLEKNLFFENISGGSDHPSPPVSYGPDTKIINFVLKYFLKIVPQLSRYFRQILLKSRHFINLYFFTFFCIKRNEKCEENATPKKSFFEIFF